MKKNRGKKQEVSTRRDVLKTGLCSLGLSLLPLASAHGQRYGRGGSEGPLDFDPASPAIAFNPNRCERCGECRAFCQGVTTVHGWAGPEVPYPCISCGQCTLICQGRAITERFRYPEVVGTLQQNEKICVASIAPSIRVSLGEMFGLMPGTNVESKLIQGLRQCGFKYVFDTSFAADVVVMEEAAELVRRLNDSDAKLPMFTSCCPAWIRFAELFYPNVLAHLSTVKSPFLVQGALVKSWFAQKEGIDPANIVHVAIAPCTAKKYEITKPEYDRLDAKGQPLAHDLDFSLTTRELGYLLQSAGISRLPSLESSTFDSLLGQASGAGMIFGSAGGVLEATMRTAWWLLNKEDPPETLLNWEEIRGTNAIKTATVDLKKRSIRVASVQGTANIRAFLEQAKTQGLNYDVIEMMACPGGCIGGGGQPYSMGSSWESLCKRRAAGLFTRDRQSEVRTSYSNPGIKALYDEYLKETNSELARQLLHVARTS